MKLLCRRSAVEFRIVENNNGFSPKQESLQVHLVLLANTRAITTTVEKMSDNSPNTHGHARASSTVTWANQLPSESGITSERCGGDEIGGACVSRPARGG
jgi:hypothetical protein